MTSRSWWHLGVTALLVPCLVGCFWRRGLELLPPGGDGGVTSAQLEATRLSGTAPLAVLFDATGTTSATAGLDTFRQVIYAFDFGDERGETWAISGLPKNTQTGGPLAAHVFDVPGTYVVSVHTVESGGGASSDASATIVVDDPDMVYAGSLTVCVSPTGAFAGCPSDAAHVTALPTAASWSGMRVLLNRGESFDAISLQDGNSGVQIGAYGTGAKPRVAKVGIGSWRPATAAFATDITAMDLDVQNGMVQSLGSRVLFYRNDVAGGMHLGEEAAWVFGDQWAMVPSSAFYNAREIFFVENNGLGVDPSSANYGVFGSGSRVALLGNTYGKQLWDSVHLFALNRGVIAHNELQGLSSSGNRYALDLHSSGLAPYADTFVTNNGNGWASSQIVIANNLLGNAADNNYSTLAICPQNSASAEGIENVIVENNRFVRGTATSADLILAGRDLTYRGNTVVGGETLIAETVTNGALALPAEWQGPYFAE